MFHKIATAAAVHELAASDIPRAYFFRGTKEVTAPEIAKLLGLGLVQYKRQAGMPGPSSSPGLGRFLLPYSECDYTLESIIDDLQVCLRTTAGLLTFDCSAQHPSCAFTVWASIGHSFGPVSLLIGSLTVRGLSIIIEPSGSVEALVTKLSQMSVIVLH